MDPKVPHNASQCATCWKFTGSSCLEFTSKDHIVAEGSCGLYSTGTPNPENKGQEHGGSTPKEAGYVIRKVRCEHCEYFEDGDNDCLLFRTLNIPNYKVDPDGCCNANEAKDEEKEKPNKAQTLKRYTR